MTVLRSWKSTSLQAQWLVSRGLGGVEEPGMTHNVYLATREVRDSLRSREYGVQGYKPRKPNGTRKSDTVVVAVIAGNAEGAKDGTW